MVNYPTLFLATLLLLGGTVSATTYSPRRFASAAAAGERARTFFYANGTMHVIKSDGFDPTPASFDEWLEGYNFADPPTSITNVLPTSDFAAVNFISQKKAGLLIMRAFYQTTKGNIRSVLFNGTAWGLDPTIIATAATFETPIAAFRGHNSTKEVIVVQYLGSNGLLTERISTTEGGNWGPPTTVTT